jgi:hypothetical protein
MPDSTRDLRLPLGLCQAVEHKFAARFGSLEQFMVFVLQELVRDDAAQIDRAEQRVIEERLKDLGYI